MREDAGAIYPFTGAENILQMLAAFYDEIQRLQPSICTCISEIDHLDSIRFDEADQIGPGKVIGRFVEVTNQRIWIQDYSIVHNKWFLNV